MNPMLSRVPAQAVTAHDASAVAAAATAQQALHILAGGLHAGAASTLRPAPLQIQTPPFQTCARTRH